MRLKITPGGTIALSYVAVIESGEHVPQQKTLQNLPGHLEWMSRL